MRLPASNPPLALPTTSGAVRLGQWSIIAAGALLAWALLILGAIWQGPFMALFFPAGWCLYVALRQYRQISSSPPRG